MKKKYKIRNVLIPVQEKQNFTPYLSKKLHLSTSDFTVVECLKQSIDARQKHSLKWNYTIVIETSKPPVQDCSEYVIPKPYIVPKIRLSNPHPFIIGSGPAGLFAALELVDKGFSPFLFEQGDSLDIRSQKVNHFWETGMLDTKSNVQFGEGGAGAFSDGKLTARNQDFYSKKVLDYLVRFGASPSILYEALPHLGTDGIRTVVKAIRSYLLDNGCQFFYRHQLDDIECSQNRLRSVRINGNQYEPEALFLAVGNASRSTFSMLENKIPLEAKPFAVGFRIEHPQDFINQTMYGKNAPFDVVGKATYRLTSKYKNRGIYSFCMCPGGFVIAGSSSSQQIVTNGMSFQARQNTYANSAIVVSIQPDDCKGNSLKGMHFQIQLEEKAYRDSLPFAAPIQTAKHFVGNQSGSGNIASSYRPGTYPANFCQLFPANVAKALQNGLLQFDKKMPGFIGNGVLIGPETRTSSPIRILRDKESFHSLAADNLFPIGEGSGYSGGIVSSAADGMKAAAVIFDR